MSLGRQVVRRRRVRPRRRSRRRRCDAELVMVVVVSRHRRARRRRHDDVAKMGRLVLTLHFAVSLDLQIYVLRIPLII